MYFIFRKHTNFSRNEVFKMLSLIYNHIQESPTMNESSQTTTRQCVTQKPELAV